MRDASRFVTRTLLHYSLAAAIAGEESIQLTPNIDRLLTGIADHLYFRDRQMSVLSITFLHAAVLRSFFRVFLHAVHFCETTPVAVTV